MSISAILFNIFVLMTVRLKLKSINSLEIMLFMSEIWTQKRNNFRLKIMSIDSLESKIYLKESNQQTCKNMINMIKIHKLIDVTCVKNDYFKTHVTMLFDMWL